MSGLRLAVADGLVISWRNLKRVPRIPELAIFAILQSIMFVLLFAFVFGGAIPLPGGGSYRQFLMPGIEKSASKGWDDFFRNKREIHATLRVLNVDVKGDTATAHLDFSYAYTDAKSGEKRAQRDLKYTAVLERTGGATWSWRDFK